MCLKVAFKLESESRLDILQGRLFQIRDIVIESVSGNYIATILTTLYYLMPSYTFFLKTCDFSQSREHDRHTNWLQTSND